MKKLIWMSATLLCSVCHADESFNIEEFLCAEIDRINVQMEECAKGIESSLDIQAYYYLLGQKCEAEYFLQTYHNRIVQ